MTDNSVDLDLDRDLGEEEDPRAQFLERLAEGMAILSEASDVPKTVTPVSSSFTSDDVDFDSDGWMSQLAEIQGWLNFDKELPLTGPDDFLSALVAALGLDSSDALEGGAESRLTPHGLERLVNRIDTALRIQRDFLEQLSTPGASLPAASASWDDAWEEDVASGEPISPEPVTAKAAVWPIFQLTKKPPNLTPSYQRGDVWKANDRQALIESILRGVPLPSIILLRTGASTPHEVVDGKQRLTAILRFVGKHPVALAKITEMSARHGNKLIEVNEVVDGTKTKVQKTLRQLFDEDYPAFRRAWKALEGVPLSARLEDTYYFPFRLRSSGDGGLVGAYLQPLRGKYYTEIKENLISVANQTLPVEELFEGMADYTVPVIEYTKANQRQIHDVFRLYNKQGVHLNSEEIRNAIYHDLEITRATLVAAGDVDPRSNVADIAKSLVGVKDLDQLAPTLKSYGFGDPSRYKRTKVLSWVISVLLHDTVDKPFGTTSQNIDMHLNAIQKVQTKGGHMLGRTEVLADLFTLLVETFEIHSSHDELWPETFRYGEKGAKWQELQLVGSLVGIAFALVASPDDAEDRIEANAATVYQRAKNQWKRPEKTQTRTQWTYIARIVREFLELLDIDPDLASHAMRKRFGSSGYESLQREPDVGKK